jgi:hypothetical protein
MELPIAALIALATLVLLARAACRQAPRRPPRRHPCRGDP